MPRRSAAASSLVAVALGVAVVGLFTPAFVGGVAIVLGVFVQFNSLVAWVGRAQA